jgi:hypothetical protein
VGAGERLFSVGSSSWTPLPEGAPRSLQAGAQDFVIVPAIKSDRPFKYQTEGHTDLITNTIAVSRESGKGDDVPSLLD